MMDRFVSVNLRSLVIREAPDLLGLSGLKGIRPNAEHRILPASVQGFGSWNAEV